jgi:hypothetical protein
MIDEAAAAAGGSLTPGVLLANRFRIEELLLADGSSELYRARDVGTGTPATVRLVPVSATLQQDLPAAQQVTHRSVARVVANGLHGAVVFVAAEWEEGHTLRQLIDAQRAAGQTVGMAYAHTLLGHVLAALGEIHKRLAHGALTPEAVWLAGSGRVFITDLGLARAVPQLAGRGGPNGAPRGLYAAPEIHRGGAPSVSADLYGVGAMLYECLTGVPPTSQQVPPSQAIPGVPPSMDIVVARALSPDPRGRFASAEEMTVALNAAVHGVDPSQVAPPPRNTAGRSFDVASAAGLEASAEKWLIQKDKLDYGPFSTEQVMAQLQAGAFGPEDVIVDTESGARAKIKEHALVGEFALQSERKIEQARRMQAEHATEHVERKKSRATALIVGGVAIALAGGVALFLLNRKAAVDTQLASRAGEADIDEFLKNVKFEFAQTRKKGARRPSSGGGGKGDDFSMDMVLGDVSQGGGDEVLSDGVIQNVMMGNFRKLVPCVMEEKRRSPGLNDVEIEFVVLGSGKVSAVRTNGQRQGAFPSCVLGRMQAFAFPKYNGRKTVASWSMSLR